MTYSKEDIIRVASSDVLTNEELAEYTGEDDTIKAIRVIARNPQKVAKLFSLNPEQTRNVKSIIGASGAGASIKYLGEALGDELAGAVGGFLSGYIARKLFGR